MTTPPDPWMCQQCQHNPVPTLGEKLCQQCAADGDQPDAAIVAAKGFLERATKATAHKNKEPMLAIALALQGILTIQIAQAETVSVGGEYMMPLILPETEPGIGPKTWGP